MLVVADVEGEAIWGDSARTSSARENISPAEICDVLQRRLYQLRKVVPVSLIQKEINVLEPLCNDKNYETRQFSRSGQLAVLIDAWGEISYYQTFGEGKVSTPLSQQTPPLGRQLHCARHTRFYLSGFKTISKITISTTEPDSVLSFVYFRLIALSTFI